MNNVWTANDIPDQSGKIALITGANSGIGLETVRELARKGAQVILAVRNPKKGEAAVADIKAELPTSNLSVELLDLASLDSVRDFAKRINGSIDRLDLLINNAGIMAPPYRKTVDGFESQFGTNHLGHFLLTALLFPLLKSTNASRIVNVSSGAHRFGNLDFEDLNWEKRKYSRWKSYGDTKIANLYFTYELTRRLDNSGLNIMTTAAHPGWTATNLQKGAVLQMLNKLFSQDAAMGALPTLMAATEPSSKPGEYYGPSGKNERKGHPIRVDSNSLSQDQNIAERLWQVSEELTGVSFSI